MISIIELIYLIRHGVDMGSLRVYLRSLISDNFTTESVVWTLDGPQGEAWRHGFVPIQPNGRYQIILDGVRGKAFEADIALDDIGVLLTDSCVLQPSQADPIEMFRQKIACGFEQNFCQWELDPTGKFNWTRHTENTPSIDTGPSSGKQKNIII
jgi:hypothetical protein